MAKQTNSSRVQHHLSTRVSIAAETGAVPEDTLVLLARQFASALVNELRAQFSTADTTTEQTKSSGTRKVLPAKERAVERFHSFNLLPDDACVDVRVVAGLFGCSVATVWRRVASGILPEPERIVGTTRWSVAKLRSVRAGCSVDRDMVHAERPSGRPNASKRKSSLTEAEPTAIGDV